MWKSGGKNIKTVVQKLSTDMEDIKKIQIKLIQMKATISHIKNTLEGRLTGSTGRACNSWLWGHEFEPHFGHKDYLRNKTKQKQNKHTLDGISGRSDL